MRERFTKKSGWILKRGGNCISFIIGKDSESVLYRESISAGREKEKLSRKKIKCKGLNKKCALNNNAGKEGKTPE